MIVQVKIECPCCGYTIKKQRFNIHKDDQTVEWKCPDCGATRTIKFEKLPERKKAKSEHVARVPNQEE